MGVALGGALDDHKEAVEGSMRLAQEAAAAVAARKGEREGGHGHSAIVHKHGKEGEAAAVDHSHKAEKEEHKHAHSQSHSHDEHEREGETKVEEETENLNHDHSHSHDDHDDEHSHDHDHTHSHDGHHHHHHDHGHEHEHDHSNPGKTASQTTAETRFRIGTFIYLQRKPFHPDRFADFLEEMAASSYTAVENVVGAKVKTANGEGFGTSSSFPPSSPSSSSSSPLMTSVLSGLLRSKGFLWLACSDQAALYFSHAGRALSVSCMGRWWASVPRESWPEGREKDIWEDFGGEGEGGREGGFGDRRNELVFIGVGLFEEERQQALKERLDACLLTGEEGEGREGGWGGEMGLYVVKAEEGSALALFDAFPNRIEIDMAGAPDQQ